MRQILSIDKEIKNNKQNNEHLLSLSGLKRTKVYTPGWLLLQKAYMKQFVSRGF